MNGETVTVVTVDGFVNPIVVVVVFLKNGDCKGWTLEVNGAGGDSFAAVAFLFMYEFGLGGFFQDGSYVFGTAGACLLVVMLLALALAGTDDSNLFLAWLVKLELWGKASFGLLRKSGIICVGGLCSAGDFDSNTTLVSTFSIGTIPSDIELGSVAARPGGLFRKVEKDVEAWTADNGLMSAEEEVGVVTVFLWSSSTACS